MVQRQLKEDVQPVSKDPVSSLRATTARDVKKVTNGKICDGCRGGRVRDSGLLLGLAE